MLYSYRQLDLLKKDLSGYNYLSVTYCLFRLPTKITVGAPTNFSHQGEFCSRFYFCNVPLHLKIVYRREHIQTDKYRTYISSWWLNIDVS